MTSDSSDSVYDFVPVQRVRENGTPSPAPDPVQLEYRRAVPPIEPVNVVAGKAQESSRKLSMSEQAFYWVRAVGALVVILLGVLWLVFVDHEGFVGPAVGLSLIGIGFALLMVSGPSEAEKKGYHF